MARIAIHPPPPVWPLRSGILGRIIVRVASSRCPLLPTPLSPDHHLNPFPLARRKRKGSCPSVYHPLLQLATCKCFHTRTYLLPKFLYNNWPGGMANLHLRVYPALCLPQSIPSSGSLTAVQRASTAAIPSQHLKSPHSKQPVLQVYPSSPVDIQLPRSLETWRISGGPNLEKPLPSSPAQSNVWWGRFLHGRPGRDHPFMFICNLPQGCVYCP